MMMEQRRPRNHSETEHSYNKHEFGVKRTSSAAKAEPRASSGQNVSRNTIQMLNESGAWTNDNSGVYESDNGSTNSALAN